MPLTAKQAAFCREYVIDLNGAQAAIRAGYSPKFANRIASENLTKIDVSTEIARLQKGIVTRSELSVDWVVRKIREEAEDRSDEASQSGRLKALELLGKHLGMFRDKLEVTGKDGGALAVSLTPDQRADALAGMFALAAARLKPAE